MSENEIDRPALGYDLEAEMKSLTYADIEDFLQEKFTQRKCPSCATSGWDALMAPEYQFGIPTFNTENGDIQVTYVPFVPVICKNCGYIHQYASSIIAAWKRGKLKSDGI